MLVTGLKKLISSAMSYKTMVFFFGCTILIASCSKLDSDWKSTKAKNTAEGFQQFINQNPKSKYESIAKDIIEELMWKSVSQAGNPERLEEYISSHEDGRYSD
ncbi:MAG: hypothetical protein GY797_18560 [Deltaproteobacteria bacterium]|nr:hypothetical protein [Deltaproteobacteria bacterium]